MTNDRDFQPIPEDLPLPLSEGHSGENLGEDFARISRIGRWVRYILVALIIGFFLMPVVAVCFLDCKVYAAKKMAHVLLFFFR